MLEGPTDLTEKADSISVYVWRHLAIEERLLARLDDAGEHERHTGRTGGPDRAVRPLLGGHPADPQHVVLLALAHRPALPLDRIRDHPHAGQLLRRGCALRPADRHQ